MKIARLVVRLGLTGIMVFSLLAAQQKAGQSGPKGPATTYRGTFPLNLKAGEYDLQTVILDFPPGAGVPLHKHGGYVLVTVLGGELTLTQNGMVKKLAAGENWMENPGVEHSVMNAGATSARAVVNILLPKGAEVTTIIKK